MSSQAAYHSVFCSSPSPYSGRPEHYGPPSSSYTDSTSAKDDATATFSSSPMRSPGEARNEAENQGPALFIILFSRAVFIAVLGPALILLALIFVFNSFERDGLGVTTSTDLQNLLTISQIVATVVSKSVPVFMLTSSPHGGSNIADDCPSRTDFSSAANCGMEKSIHDPFAISLPEGTAAPERGTSYTSNSTINDVKYLYEPASNDVGGSYQIISSDISSSRMAYIVAIGFHMGVLQKHPPSRIEGAGLRGGSYTTAFAQELSRELMSLIAAMYEPIPVTAIQRASAVLGSRVQLIPLGLYLGRSSFMRRFRVLRTMAQYWWSPSLWFLNSLTTLIIGIAALIEAQSVRFVKLVHLRITSSLPIVHALFCPVDCSRTWNNDGVEMFSKESDKDRLYVGPVRTQTEGDSFSFARAG
ncbi:hypothetical protein FRC01_004395 [Tulasnella sp. 417]|nr:hypothetical protein FRC01_004395 [Tulasnella sp. 417]